MVMAEALIDYADTEFSVNFCLCIVLNCHQRENWFLYSWYHAVGVIITCKAHYQLPFNDCIT